MRRFKHVHYGWIVVACGALIMGATHGVIANCFSLYLRPVTEDLQLSRQSFSTCQMIVNLLYMVISLLSGKIYEKVSPHFLMKIAGVTLPAAYFSYSLCTEIWQFYAVSAVVGISVAFLTFLPFTLILNEWFEERRGLAVGICFMGSGLGGMIFNTLASQWITMLGWRGTYRTLALIMLVILLPSIYLVLKPTPASANTFPYGEKNADTANEVKYGYSFAEAIRNANFYLMILLALIIGLTTTMVGNTIIPHLSDLGFSTTIASGVMSTYLGGLAVCKVLLGTMIDKLGARKSTFFALLATMLGLVGLYFGQLRVMHVLIVGGAALGCASCTVSYPQLTRYALGNVAFATLYGVINAANSLTTSLSPVITNALFDSTGSYNVALIMGIALCAAALFLLPFLKSAKVPDCGSK